MDGNEIIVCVIYWKFLVCKLTLITDDILYVTRFPQHCIIINFLSVIKAYGGIKSCLVFCHFLSYWSTLHSNNLFHVRNIYFL